MNINSDFEKLTGPVKSNYTTSKIKRLATPEECFNAERCRDAVSKMYDYAMDSNWMGVYPTKTYFTEAEKFPTLSRLIYNDEIVNRVGENFTEALEQYIEGDKKAYNTFLEKRNKFIQEHTKTLEHQTVQEAKDKFMDRIAKDLYSRSWAMRETLYKYDAIKLNEVTPKTRGLKKFLMGQEIKKLLKAIGR